MVVYGGSHPMGVFFLRCGRWISRNHPINARMASGLGPDNHGSGREGDRSHGRGGEGENRGSGFGFFG